MNLYKINDIINYEFFKMPKSLFANPKYRRLSSDAKLTYALLYDRLSLSKLNACINENDEVYLIYTRDEIAEDLGIKYKKAIAAFKELVEIKLITEQRCGRGMPNRIYIVKPELDIEDAKQYIKHEKTRTADSACLAKQLSKDSGDPLTTTEGIYLTDVPISNIKNCQNSTSRTAETEYLDMPNRHPNKTNNIKTNNNHTDNSQSVILNNNISYTQNCEETHSDGQTDDVYSLDEILENCQLEVFDEEEQKILYDALERLFYSENLKIGNAVLPRRKVSSRMYEIEVTTLQSAMNKLHRNVKQIKNVTAYVMSTIFNCITEDYSMLHTDPYLNSLRKD